jgi:hypothetical protein
MAVEEFRPQPLPLRLPPVLRFHRYRDLSQVAPPILDVAKEMVTLAERLIDPRVAFTRWPVARVHDTGLALGGGPSFEGRCFAAHLAGAGEAVAFVATIGPALDERTMALSDAGDLLEALFLDTAGWLAIEDAVRSFRAHVREMARRSGARLSPRLAPGYLDWPLTEQAAFFSLFAGAPLPVALSEHCVMTPRKSVSGLFGLLPGERP